MNFLNDKGWLKEKQGKELCIVADNCPGQNENNMTMRLALSLAEKKLFLTATFAFHVAGHTKNSCDRWFNSLKKVSRRSNLFAMEQLKEKFAESERIHVAIAGTYNTLPLPTCLPLY